MKKRVLAMLLVMCMLLGMTACGEKKTSTGEVDTSEHVTITYMFTGDKPDGAAYDRLEEYCDICHIHNDKVQIGFC